MILGPESPVSDLQGQGYWEIASHHGTGGIGGGIAGTIQAC